MPKTGQTKTHRSLVRVYRANVVAFHRAVAGWLQLVQAAVLYGVEQQLIRGRLPDLARLPPPTPGPEPANLLRKALWLARAEETVKAFSGDLSDADPEEVGGIAFAHPMAIGANVGGPGAILAKARRPAFGRVDAEVAHLVDWHCLRMKGDLAIGRMHASIFIKAAGKAAQIAKWKVSWDVVNHRAVDWAASRSAQLVTRTTAGIRQAIRDEIATGIEQGYSMPTVGRRLRGLAGPKGQTLIGLNAPQAAALRKYEAALKAEGLDLGRVARLVDRERRKKLIYRTEMISRTETAASVSEGTLGVYAEAGENMVEFESSADACPTCLPMNGTKYALDASSGIIPVHPNCRCTWMPVARAKV